MISKVNHYKNIINVIYISFCIIYTALAFWLRSYKFCFSILVNKLCAGKVRQKVIYNILYIRNNADNSLLTVLNDLKIRAKLSEQILSAVFILYLIILL